MGSETSSITSISCDNSAINELKGNVTFGIENAERCKELSREKPLNNTPTAIKKRRGKWVKFSGIDEELAKIALEHAKYQAARRRPLLLQISNSMSRRNGFNCKEDFDTVCEHWSWSLNNSYDDNLQLQAVNCSVCGNYICTGDPNFQLIDCIQCNCNDVALEEFREYEYEEKN